MGAATQEDVALMERALPVLSPHQADFAGFAIARNPLLWQAWRDRYAQAMAEGSLPLPQRTVDAITLMLAREGVAAEDAEALRPAMAQALARMQSERPSRHKVRTLLAAERVGLDARRELEGIRLVGLPGGAQGEVMEALRSGIYAFPPVERRRLAPATVAVWADMLAPWREGPRIMPLPRTQVQGLKFLAENGAEAEMRALLADLPVRIAEPAAAGIAAMRTSCG